MGCYKEHSFRDCELSCTDELGCPSGLTCLAGMCRESGATGACSTTAMDGMVDAAPDRDGDGVADDGDNCPDMMNPDQANEDLDEFGDVCDICPISANNADADHDNVGDDCDPDGNTQDHILLFEGFNTAPAAGQPYGDTWTFGNGVATVNSRITTSMYLWPTPNAVSWKLYTSAALDPTGFTPNTVGTAMGADGISLIGVGCANYVRQDSNRELAVVNIADTSEVAAASGSTFANDGDYPITEMFINGATQCGREQFQANGSAQTASPGGWGLYVHQAQGTFDYVLITGH